MHAVTVTIKCGASSDEKTILLPTENVAFSELELRGAIQWPSEVMEALEAIGKHVGDVELKLVFDPPLITHKGMREIERAAVELCRSDADDYDSGESGG